MPLPASFKSFQVVNKRRFRGVMIGTEGRPNSGKSELILSAPGPGIFLALDRSHQGMLDNPEPPEARNADSFVIYPIQVHMPTACNQQQALAQWRDVFYPIYKSALENPDARTVALDGDSDSVELQMLAEYGRVTQIPQLLRTNFNAARRAFYNKAKDSGKVVIMTNKVKKRYDKQWDASGNPVPDPSKPGEQLATWDGKSFDRQGFNDYEYAFDIQLKHLHREAMVDAKGNKKPPRWGIKILMCKPNRKLEGDELWGQDCNIPALLEYVYPHIPLTEWGYV